MNVHTPLRCFIAVIGLLFAAASLAAPPSDKPPVSADVKSKLQQLESRLNALEALTKRLNGYTAATIERGGSASFDAQEGDKGTVEIFLVFCEDGLAIECNENTSGALIASTGLFDDSANRTVISLNAGNTPDFAQIAALLTNGNGEDRVTISRRACLGFCSTGSLSTIDRNLFFFQQQPSTATGFDDLQGLEIAQISVSIDRLSEFFDTNDSRLNIDIDYRVMFEIVR